MPFPSTSPNLNAGSVVVVVKADVVAIGIVVVVAVVLDVVDVVSIVVVVVVVVVVVLPVTPVVCGTYRKVT